MSARPDSPATPGSTTPDEERRSLLEEIYGPDGPPDFEAFSGPLHWPALPAADAPRAWQDLRTWVEALVERYPHLDHHVIPNCWWLHNSHVEALQALRDHERLSYTDTSPATAGVDWHRAFAFIETRLREWTAQTGCGATHEPHPHRLQPPPDDQWEAFVTADQQHRHRPAQPGQ